MRWWNMDLKSPWFFFCEGGWKGCFGIFGFFLFLMFSPHMFWITPHFYPHMFCSKFSPFHLYRWTKTKGSNPSFIVILFILVAFKLILILVFFGDELIKLAHWKNKKMNLGGTPIYDNWNMKNVPWWIMNFAPLRIRIRFLKMLVLF